MDSQQLIKAIDALGLSQDDVQDVRIVQDEKLGTLAVGVYRTMKNGLGVVIVQFDGKGEAKPVRMRLEGAHRIPVIQVLGAVLNNEAGEE